MSGTINLALTQQFDTQGDPLSGGLLEFFVAGTTTPQTPFQDTALTIAHPNPIILDASGRVPMFYLADGFIKIRLKDKNGVVIIAADQLLVIGPSSGGGGGGGSFDPNTVLQTGDIKCRYGTGTLTGFARCNGNTIGATGSSATELAGPTAQALYEYLWPFSNILLDSATKGASAVADFGALKRLILPDIRGRVIAGMDDMGALAGAAARLTSTYFGTSAIALGAVGGDEKNLLSTATIPAHSHGLNSATGSAVVGLQSADHSHGIPSMTTGTESANHTHSYSPWQAGNIGVAGTNTVGAASAAADTNTGIQSANHSHTIPANTYNTGNVSANHSHALSGSTQNNTGGDGSHANVQPSMVMTIYIKL